VTQSQAVNKFNPGGTHSQSAHDIIGRMFGMFPNRFILEKEILLDNVSGKIDIYDKLHNCVIEIKTSSSQKLLLKPFII
jgi:hypothetical protein